MGAEREQSGEGPLTAVLLLHNALSYEQRRRLMLVVSAMLIGTIAELVSIGAVVPFLALVANVPRAAETAGWSTFLTLVKPGTEQQLIARAVILLISAGVFAAAMRLLIVRLSQNFVLHASHEISTRIFSNVLRQPYHHLLSQNSADLLSGFERLQILTNGVMMPCVQGIVAAVLASAILVLLFWIEPTVAGLLVGSAALIHFAVLQGLRRRLAGGSLKFSQNATMRLKTVQEALGSIRDIRLHNSMGVVEKGYKAIDYRFRRFQAEAAFIAAAPRFVLEGVGIAAVGIIALLLSGRPGGLAQALPILGALAFGAQRLLPLLQQVYQGVALVFANHGVVRDTLALLNLPAVPQVSPKIATLPFEKEVRLEAASYHFPCREERAVETITLTIPRGSRLGITGPTGSGKSTLLDLIMGLLEPQEGRITIDGVILDDQTRARWQRQIAHVPQAIYLLDGSIAANIAFHRSKEDIDIDRVRHAAARAQIHDFISALPNGYDEVVGERGVKLSGGQRQRIAIARALYHRASLLILDEATSALDDAVASAVMRQLAEGTPEITIIIVAHQAEALTWCDTIVRLNQGRIHSIETVPATGSMG